MTRLDRKTVLQTVQAVLSDPSVSLRFAANGWLDALLYDDAFIGRLDSTPLLSEHGSSVTSSPAESAEDILKGLGSIDDKAACLASLRSLARSDHPKLVKPDPPSTPIAETVLVVGAGPVGLLTALILRNHLDPSVCVRIMERRCDEAGNKRPYNRDWLTHIEFAPLAALLPADVMQIVKNLCDARCGLPINLIETLLLLAVRRSGVECDFRSADSLSAEDMKNVIAVFDASGGSWTSPVATVAANAPAAVTLPPERQHGLAFVQAGYPAAIDHAAMTIALDLDGHFAKPVHKGRPIELAMIKVTAIPARCHGTLYKAVANQNADHKFYIWHGNMAAESNELLVIAKLNRSEHRALMSAFENVVGTLQIRDVLAKATRGLSQRLVALLKEIEKACDKTALPLVQPPFVYAPRWLAVPQCCFTWCDTPVIKLGDSVYNGNPVSGNGLAGHINQLVAIQRALLATASTSADSSCAA